MTITMPHRMTLMTAPLIAAAVLLLPLDFTSPREGDAARKIFAGPAGDDSAPGTDIAPVRTLTVALALASGGDTIYLRSGTYPMGTTRINYTSPVTVVSSGRKRARVDGMTLSGTSNLRFRRVAFEGPVRVTADPVLGYRDPSTNVSFSRVAFSIGSPRVGSCLKIDTAASRINVTRSRFRRCGVGISGSANSADPSAHHISIVGNSIAKSRGDGIHFGDWDDVRILRNVIKDMADPAHEIHNDGIQFLGDSSRVVIARNRVTDSQGQLLLIQPAFGPIDDVLVENNLFVGAGATAIQSQGARNVRLINNTVWRSRFGSLNIRSGPSGPASDTVIANNVLKTLSLSEGARARYLDYNLVRDCKACAGPHGLSGVDPRFVSPKRNRFGLRPRSPAAHAGNRKWGPPVDLRGRRRAGRPSLGAFEVR
jgi:hypothetical protein